MAPKRPSGAANPLVHVAKRQPAKSPQSHRLLGAASLPTSPREKPRKGPKVIAGEFTVHPPNAGDTCRSTVKSDESSGPSLHAEGVAGLIRGHTGSKESQQVRYAARVELYKEPVRGGASTKPLHCDPNVWFISTCDREQPFIHKEKDITRSQQEFQTDGASAVEPLLVPPGDEFRRVQQQESAKFLVSCCSCYGADPARTDRRRLECSDLGPLVKKDKKSCAERASQP
ncbi:hypothetical protein B0H10DRAFT_1950141 [Mycena sp. CBHHK59/15]|nr:hypothetical protein B0H10DRAFT_1950141 [Mycena sp. CBHHK59/15]